MKISQSVRNAAQLLVGSTLCLARKQTSIRDYIEGQRFAAKFVLKSAPKPMVKSAVNHWVKYFQQYPNHI